MTARIDRGRAAILTGLILLLPAFAAGAGTTRLPGAWAAPASTPTATQAPAGTGTAASSPTSTRTPTATPALGLSSPSPTAIPPSATPTCAPGWQQVDSPNADARYNALQGLAVRTAGDAWAVGSYYPDAGGELTLILHWDGMQWSLVPSPNREPALFNRLNAVAALAADDAWAVGQTVVSGETQALLAHWDGVAWRLVSSPDLGTTSALLGITALGPQDIWAVGYYGSDWPPQALALHWNGQVWAIVPSATVPMGTLSGVAARAPDDVWAAGYRAAAGTPQTLIEHWNGSTWTVVASPNVAGADNVLRAVAAPAANDAWVVGVYHVGGTEYTLTERWDGQHWTIAGSPNPSPGDNSLFGVVAPAADDVWAAGYTGPYLSHAPLILHWDGTAWRVVAGPSPAVDADLVAVAALPGDDIWAAGAYGDPPLTSATLVERYTSQCGTPPPAQASATPARTATAGPPTPTPTGTPTTVASPTPCALNFADVDPAEYFYVPVQYLACRGVISGYADGTFRPYNVTTRGQIAKIVVFGFGIPIATPASGAYTFADVAPDHPFFAVIETAAAHGIVGGYTCGGPGEPCDSQQRPYFRPYADVTRGQLAKIVVGAAGWSLQSPPSGTFADVPPGSAFYAYAETAVCRGIISGYTCGGPGEPCDATNRPYFRLGNAAVRGQIAKIVYLALTAGTACGP